MKIFVKFNNCLLSKEKKKSKIKINFRSSFYFIHLVFNEENLN